MQPCELRRCGAARRAAGRAPGQQCAPHRRRRPRHGRRPRAGRRVAWPGQRPGPAAVAAPARGLARPAFAAGAAVAECARRVPGRFAGRPAGAVPRQAARGRAAAGRPGRRRAGAARGAGARGRRGGQAAARDRAGARGGRRGAALCGAGRAPGARPQAVSGPLRVHRPAAASGISCQPLRRTGLQQARQWKWCRL